MKMKDAFRVFVWLFFFAFLINTAHATPYTLTFSGHLSQVSSTGPNFSLLSVNDAFTGNFVYSGPQFIDVSPGGVVHEPFITYIDYSISFQEFSLSEGVITLSWIGNDSLGDYDYLGLRDEAPHGDPLGNVYVIEAVTFQLYSYGTTAFLDTSNPVPFDPTVFDAGTFRIFGSYWPDGGNNPDWSNMNYADLRQFSISATIDSVHAPVPEPSTILLLGFGVVGLVGFRKRFGR